MSENDDFVGDSQKAFGSIMGLIYAHQVNDKQMSVDLMSNFYEQKQKLEIELELIRDQVYDLLAGDYMPTPNAIKNALWVDKERVDAVYEKRRVK